MTRKNVILIIVLVVLASLLMGCDGSETQSNAAESLTVDAVVENRTEATSDELTCEFTFISTDYKVRLPHYRQCVAGDDQEAKRIERYDDALEACFCDCDELYPDESGSKTQDNVDCVARCKAY